MRATRAIIRLDRFEHNIAQIRRAVRRADGTSPLICLAVKADAYGHGIVPIGLAAAGSGVDYLAVATVDEGVELRAAGSTLPILLYGIPVPEEIAAVVAHRLTPMVSDAEQIELFNAEATTQSTLLPVHLKIDTGMGRVGCRPDDGSRLAGMVRASGSLALGGVCTHFAASDSDDPAYTAGQIAAFEQALSRMKAEGIDPGIVHAANSGGVLGHPASWYDMVRPGILAYGYYPSDCQERLHTVLPVMELRSSVVFIKEVERGDAISYGMTWRAPHRTHIGTIPVGYGDGYNRLLSNRGHVSIHGTRYPVVGRVCMDQLMVDLGAECTVRRYDEAKLFGYGDGVPSAEDIAGICGTIAYEVTCAISRRVPRVYADRDP